MMNNDFKKITVCLDMAGCPNRCRHCWLGHSKNEMLRKEELTYTAGEFENHCEELEVYSWFREPDYRADYRELWALENSLIKTCKPQRYELFSVWRLCRDNEYVEWLKKFDIKKYQLTFFGIEEKTDRYTGRKGAFNELIYATEILLANGLIPRWQAFAYHDNVLELKDILELSKELKLKARCEELGGEFEMFFHQGSCEGEGRKLYNNRLISDDLKHIPSELIASAEKHLKCDSVQGFLGKTEAVLMKELIGDNSVLDLSSRPPVLFINSNFDVYPNFSERSEWFKLGNLKTDGAGRILENYKTNASYAQKISNKVALCDMAKLFGNSASKRLFLKSDFRWYLLNEYCENIFKAY